ncbi:site-specific integrase [Pedobacter sp. GSP4]|uniref:site-specific integrase n=1 Tax=Pedobacter sp. GSP4 TaxID=3453716 RepID=UPI003EEEE945
MLEKSFELRFFLKKPVEMHKMMCPVYARITIDGIAREFSVKQEWPPEMWDQPACRASSGSKDAKKLNAYLDRVTSSVIDARREVMERGGEVTALAIKDMLFGKGEDGRMVLEVFTAHNKRMEELRDIDYAGRTIQRYVTTLNHTRAFIRWKFGAEDVALRMLDYDFICDYEFWLKSVQRCGHNTTMKYLTNFKKVIIQCVKRGWIGKDPFYGFRFSKRETERVFLDREDINRLTRKSFSKGKLFLVRDIFLFSCYTGLAYADVKLLKRGHIAEGIDGEQWISISRQKTGTPTRLPVLPQAMEIIQRYTGHERCRADNAVLPVFSNQKMNAYLKEIAADCGINKQLTFHTARHTFATTVTLTNGVPLETVSKMLGHTSIRHTQHYAKVIDFKISSDMRDLRSRLGAI